MLRIDSHQHFWKFDPERDSWITEDMFKIRRDFLPSDLEPLLKQNNFAGCIAVQADQSESENMFLLNIADKNDFVKGIVGWLDFRKVNVAERLEHFSLFKKMKGFRYILQGEKQRDLMLTDEFIKFIRLLGRFNFTYDILIFPDQLKFAKQLCEEFPQQKFVIDHLAKPPIKSKEINEWKADIQHFKNLKNVFCKVSGFVTEADWHGWNSKDFYPYFEVVVNTFGKDRIMFGSDWPVCLLAAEHREVVKIVEEYFTSFSEDDQNKFFGGNAIEFYNI